MYAAHTQFYSKYISMTETCFKFLQFSNKPLISLTFDFFLIWLDYKLYYKLIKLLSMIFVPIDIFYKYRFMDIFRIYLRVHFCES